MRTSTLTSLVLGSCFLVACNSGTTSIAEQNRNPLTASRYGDELADSLANLIINDSPVIKEPGMQDLVTKEIARAKEIAADARILQREGMMGVLIPVDGQTTGYALYLDDILYFSSDFEIKPRLSIHVYLTTTVDPRDAAFPDPTAIDLGMLQTTYGAQKYAVPRQDESELLRTLVLWDETLKQIVGFAQLARLE